MSWRAWPLAVVFHAGETLAGLVCGHHRWCVALWVAISIGMVFVAPKPLWADSDVQTEHSEEQEAGEEVVPPLPYEPTTSYEKRDVRGWLVLVHKSLVEEHAELGEQVLELIDFQLYQIARVVPKPALEKLRQIPIWVEYADPRHPCACYHVSRRWLRANGFNPEKAGSVEIANSRRFLEWTRDQPWMLLHELAHGYHHRFLGGYGNPEIAAAWKAAMEQGLYDEVLHCRGSRRPAYAKNNPQEYFAELSEAWFGVNDFYPFVRAEVREHDPKAAELLRRLWGQ
jgi:hypothetical protein